jgi:acetyl esterase/lipase
MVVIPATVCRSLLIAAVGIMASVPWHVAAQVPTVVDGPIAHAYSTTAGNDLKAFVFSPHAQAGHHRRAAIVLFHGGGWSMGEPEWAFSRARHFAERGMVAVAAQYRLSDQDSVTPIEAMADARAVIRWMRSNADSLDIDPGRIAAYGWSAGGHLAVCAAIFEGSSAAGNVSTVPNALVLVSPAVSVGSDGWFQHLLGKRADAQEFTPDEHVRKGMPPTLILQGSIDTVTPLAGATRFCERMRAAGNNCVLQVYEDFGHLFTPKGIPDDGWPQPDPETAKAAAVMADEFLISLGFMKDPPR